ncbi:MAG: acetyl-CoA carboxylase biotin carboxyl carrier protein [Alphaproteobacteria bacterium]
MADKKIKNINLAELKSIIELMEQKNLAVVKIQNGDSTIEIDRGTRMEASPIATPNNNTIPQPIVAAATSSPNSADVAGAIKSPVVGTVYLSPKPGEANFIKIGDKVKSGAVLMIVEAMKVMNQITATNAGTITAILVDNEDPVEFGQPLVIIS